MHLVYCCTWVLLFNLFKTNILGGLNYGDDQYDQWADSKKFNTKLVYKNHDPSLNLPWESHTSLMKPRQSHNTVELGGQLYHIAGLAKDYSTSDNNDRRVEKWLDITGTTKQETEQNLYKYTSPQSLIVSNDWCTLCAHK